ncbi:metal-dependent hydrolase [Clostridium botulinum]|uniref:metal-dependent hydrolase n=1 Tax=Clostridium botulinum TaxID=1491 RepID=UPI0004D8A2B7|nr:metal-dependent hydrolase [Clostridium botulinum]KEH98908.1 membrane protein [Clostridium botulinum D str. 16868]MCD3276747.1 metal-dependent hydrolase [Clostridium botulinum C/D]MCD3288365.1 metal-dependent hydrolase [Clostridium botulinum C/D]MCD3290884.1 metal-dependent hydrolase [Clostridium botulinum C/D]MCD3301746.1 metal-dependent hydrolase [Clostridium botulinum C/D]
MKGKTHAAIGMATFMSVYDKVPGGFNYLGIIIVGIASLLPDIDHPKSMINKYILPFKNKKTKMVIYIALSIIVLYFDYMYIKSPVLKAIGIALIFVAVSSHRNGLTHSLIGLVIFTIIASYIGKCYAIPASAYYFVIGYGMHLFCDMMTKMGIPLFYPFINKKYKMPFTYNVNSKRGNDLEEFLIIVSLVYIIYRLPGIF